MKLFKKIAAVLAAATLMLGVAGNAMAYFETTTTTTRLIRVAYDLTKGTERATDLGDIHTIIANGGGTFGGDSNAIFGGALASSNLSDVNVAYFALTTANNDLWLATNNTTQNVTPTLWASSKTAINAVAGYYKLMATSETVEIATSYGKSYYSLLDGVGVKVGAYNNLIGIGHGEINLANLVSDDSIDMNLFFWNYPSASEKTGTVTGFTISTLADGSTKVSAVPVPAAVYLLGSGLLGLVGLRRKMA